MAADYEPEEQMMVVTRNISVPMILAGVRALNKFDFVDRATKVDTFSKRKELISCMVTATLAEDAILVKLDILSDSETKFKDKKGNRAAIPTGSILQVETKIPSVILVDNEVLVTFVENLVSCIKIEHDSTTGANSIFISE